MTERLKVITYLDPDGHTWIGVSGYAEVRRVDETYGLSFGAESTLDREELVEQPDPADACATCSGPRYGSPSDFFCSHACQEHWYRESEVGWLFVLRNANHRMGFEARRRAA